MIARVLKVMSENSDKKLSHLHYNLLIGTPPIKDREEDYHHPEINILPRIARPAGFGLGSPIFTTTFPEERAGPAENKKAPKDK